MVMVVVRLVSQLICSIFFASQNSISFFCFCFIFKVCLSHALTLISVSHT